MYVKNKPTAKNCQRVSQAVVYDRTPNPEGSSQSAWAHVLALLLGSVLLLMLESVLLLMLILMLALALAQRLASSL